MTILLINNDFHFELENILRIFYPFEKIKITHEPAADDFLVTAGLSRLKDQTFLTLTVCVDGHEYSRSGMVSNRHEEYKNTCELTLSRFLFNIMVQLTGYAPKWGVLTGVRPTKLFHSLVLKEDIDFARNYFKDELFVAPEKIKLCETVVQNQKPILKVSAKKSYSLYVSIPFCPSRCDYCSFVSHSVEKAAKLIPDYVKQLCEELKIIAKQAYELGLRLETIYFGGGTPTSLAAEDLKQVFSVISQNFDLSTLREYTVEAGRPDTITKEKLSCIKAGGAGRISINPQSLQNHVLRAIGRNHTAEQVLEAYKLAREEGFDCINMDLIAGLPEDSEKGFLETVEKILSMDPENITIHTLAIKRSSYMGGDPVKRSFEEGMKVNELLHTAQKYLYQTGFLPYYMYRQSKSVGNLENVGYTKNGYACLYNVYMMEEIHSIFAAGAAAITKLCRGRDITRVYNFKYPYEYIDRFEEICERKKQVNKFYETF